MRQIAAEAGVSVVAVSCALRGGPGVSENTRARIRSIAESLGYRPDPLLSHLMYHLRSKRQPRGRHNIAYLHWPKDDYRERVLRGARSHAEQHGYHMDVIRMNEETLTPRVLQRMLIARGIAGLVFGPAPTQDYSSLLNWSNFSVVLTSHSVMQPNFNRVVPNHYSATRSALAELTKRGYRRIGLVVPPCVEEHENSFYRAAFTLRAAEQPTWPPICYHDPEIHPPSHLRTWYDAHHPDALILCYPLDDENLLCPAIGPEIVAKLGVFLLGHDVHGRSSLAINYRPHTLGEISVDQLINQLHRGERGIPAFQQTLSVEGELIVTAAPTPGLLTVA